jgi:hypothetical protein
MPQIEFQLGLLHLRYSWVVNLQEDWSRRMPQTSLKHTGRLKANRKAQWQIAPEAEGTNMESA